MNRGRPFPVFLRPGKFPDLAEADCMATGHWKAHFWAVVFFPGGRQAVRWRKHCSKQDPLSETPKRFERKALKLKQLFKIACIKTGHVPKNEDNLFGKGIR